MLTLFFTIVFIAELIVTFKIISIIKKADNKVREVNSQVFRVKPQLSKIMKSAFSGVKTTANGVGLFNKFIDNRKRQIYASIIKGVLGLVIFILIKKYPHKRWLSVVDLVFTFDNLLRT